MSDLEDKLRRLSSEELQIVDIFVGLLLQKQSAKADSPPKLDWAGALKDMRESYSSVELQHAISTWRDDNP